MARQDRSLSALMPEGGGLGGLPVPMRCPSPSRANGIAVHTSYWTDFVSKTGGLANAADWPA
jgi:hypothetical protein